MPHRGKEEVYEIQIPSRSGGNYKSYHDAKLEVAHDIVEGLRCCGCEVVIVGEGTTCFCKDELIGVLATAHESLRWHNEDCLFENHEEPTMSTKGHPALLEEADDV